MAIGNATAMCTFNPASPPVVGETREWAIAAAPNDSACDWSMTIPGRRADAGEVARRGRQQVATLQEVAVDRLPGIQCLLIEPGVPDATPGALLTVHAGAPELPSRRPAAETSDTAPEIARQIATDAPFADESPMEARNIGTSHRE